MALTNRRIKECRTRPPRVHIPLHGMPRILQVPGHTYRKKRLVKKHIDEAFGGYFPLYEAELAFQRKLLRYVSEYAGMEMEFL